MNFGRLTLQGFMAGVLALAAIVFFSLSLQAAGNEFKWGGPGFDLSSRFVARMHPRDTNLIEILVDTEQTYRSTVKMDITSEKTVVSSANCFKAYRHIEAPYACVFQKDDLQKLGASGQLQVFNSSRELLLEETVDIEALKTFIAEN